MRPNYWTIRPDRELQRSPSKTIILMTCFMVSIQWATLMEVECTRTFVGNGGDETGAGRSAREEWVEGHALYWVLITSDMAVSMDGRG